MNAENNTTDRHIRLRSNEIETAEAIAAAAQNEDERRKNHGFTQLDDIGAASFERLMGKSPKAACLFLRLCRMMDHRGAIVASRQALAALADANYANVGRLVRDMQDYGLIRRARMGGATVIAINPDIAWRSFGGAKQYAMFRAVVVIDEAEMEDTPDFDIRRARALIAMAKKAKRAKDRDPDKGQLDLPPPIGSEAEECEVCD